MPLQFNGDPDTGITYSAANSFYLLGAGTSGILVTSGGFSPLGQVTFPATTTVYYEVRTAPTGLDGYAVVFADTSGGKDRLRAIFGTGAAQAVATEP